MSDVTLRAATPADLDAMARLHALAYPGVKGTVEERARRMVDNPRARLDERTVAVEADGGLAGMYALLRSELFVGGRPVAAGGLAAVAVAPHARGRGLGRRLVDDAVATCAREKRPLCVLYPFREDFYFRLGFATVYWQHRLRFPPAWLAGQLGPVAANRRVRPAGPADAEAIAATHERWCRTTNGAMRRTVAHVGARLAEWHAWMVDDGAGGCGGYVLWRYDAPSDERQAIEVAELVAVDAPSRRALLAHLAAQRDPVLEVRLDVAVEDPLVALLVRTGASPAPHVRELHQELGVLAAGAMVRLVDVDAAVAARGFAHDGALRLILSDTPGTRARTIVVEDGVGRVAAAARAPATLRTDSRTFARLYMGALLPSEAAELGLADLEGDDEIADRLLGLERPFLVDVF